MLLHETDQDTALRVAKRLSGAMHRATGSDQVTASLGVSTWLGPDDRPEELLHRADVALYAAKRTGRDRCAIWEPSLSEAQAGLQWLGRRPRRALEAGRS
jgi:diguanylate cyclase (GGDEF)-like protein